MVKFRYMLDSMLTDGKKLKLKLNIFHVRIIPHKGLEYIWRTTWRTRMTAVDDKSMHMTDSRSHNVCS